MENKNIPEVRFAGFSGDWEQRKFQNFTKLSQGLQIAIDKRYLIPGENRMFYITNEFLNPNSDKRYYIKSPAKSVIAGKEDILMTRTGNTGKVVTNVEGAFHNNFFKIAYDNKETAKLFLYYLLNSFPIRKEILARAGTSTIPDLNHNDFYKIKVNIPSFEEQIKIGIFFKQLDDIIDLRQQQLTILRQTKQGFLQKMFPKEGESVPEVRFPGFTGDWKHRKLGENASFLKGQGYSKKDLVENGDAIILYGRLYTSYETRITEVDTYVQRMPDSIVSRGNEVIVPASGETAEDIARASAVDKSGIILGGDLNIIYPDKDIDSVFLALTISNGPPQKELSTKAQGKSVVHLRNPDLKDLELYFPCIDEQRKIGEYFENIDHLITLHQRELEALKETKKAFLQKMFV